MKKYRINEIFYSIQGEGMWSGRAAIFIRFSGCNLKCPFCDTDFSDSDPYTATEILGAIQGYPTRFIVLTGGEPTLQVDDDLVWYLKKNGYTVAMETNGTFPLPFGLDWVTVSPKDMFVSNAKIVLKDCNELKVVFDGVHTDIDYDIIAPFKFIQPCDTKDEEKNKDIMRLAVGYIKQHPDWLLSLQTQKIINVK